jgi:flavin-binding protein dodecin
MSVLKYIEVTGESPESWALAARAAIDDVQRTVRNLRHLEVTRLTARFDQDGGFVYQTTMKVAYEGDSLDDEPLALQQAEEIVADEELP